MHNTLIILLTICGFLAMLAVCGGVVWFLATEHTHAVAAELRAEIASLREGHRRIGDRIMDGEDRCDGWHGRVSGHGHNLDTVNDGMRLLDERLHELEAAAAAPPPVTEGPVLDGLVEQEPAFFNAMASALPALKELTHYVPILPVVGRVQAPGDNTETSFTRAQVREVLDRLSSAHVVDARELVATDA